MCLGLSAQRKGPSVGIFISKKIRFYKAVQNFLKKTYIYTSLYQIKQSALLSYAFVVECNGM